MNYKNLKQVKKRKLSIDKTPVSGKKTLYSDIDKLFDMLNLKDGMTLSFHHHLRNGDYVLNTVVENIAKRGYKNITLFASSIFPCHSPIVKYIKDNTITKIYAAYISGDVANAISEGHLKERVVLHTHGGRARLLQDKELEIDYSFIASPSVDTMGNISSTEGKAACGAIGYAFTDVYYSKCSIAVTDNYIDNVKDISIKGKYIDHILEIDCIGDASKIVSGTTQITKNPVGLKIASLTTDFITKSPYFKSGISFQTGAGGISLAVADMLKAEMIESNVKGSFASGGITKYIVDMLENNLFEELYDVQCFDLDAVKSISKNSNHIPISASKYASVLDDCICEKLDIVILGATEIDLDFNVNVTTTSNGVIMGGSGGHSDTAYGAKCTIIVSTLMNARISVVKEKVTTITTPGETVDVLVTERGIAINPLRKDLIKHFSKHNLKIVDIKELYDYSTSLTGKPKIIKKGGQIVGEIQYRDGTVIDYLYKKEL